MTRLLLVIEAWLVGGWFVGLDWQRAGLLRVPAVPGSHAGCRTVRPGRGRILVR